MHKPFFVSWAAWLGLTVLLGACDKERPAVRQAAPPSVARDTEELGQPADPRFIGRVWVSVTQGHPRGTVMVFLQDRTLLRASCHESYRVSKWGAADDRIRWIEETIPIEAVLSMPNDNELRLQLVGQDKVHVYVPASAPMTCPQSR